MIEVSASVLNVDKNNAITTFYNLETAKINYFHIDVMDGKFVKKNNLKLMKDYALTISNISNIGLDVHLMIENVEEQLDEYFSLNTTNISFHYEAIQEKNKIMEIINKIKQNHIKVGIAISPNTQIDEIKEFLPFIHQVIIMTVEPGEGGQKLILETLEKIKDLKKYINDNGLEIDIEADGGINGENAKKVIECGANILVSGNYIINSDNYEMAVKNLKEG